LNSTVQKVLSVFVIDIKILSPDPGVTDADPQFRKRNWL
jgi:hypothetical protein